MKTAFCLIITKIFILLNEREFQKKKEILQLLISKVTRQAIYSKICCDRERAFGEGLKQAIQAVISAN